MARYSLTDIVLGGFCPLPLDSYSVRLIKVEIKNTKATDKHPDGRPAAYTEWEITAPSHVTVGGQQFAITGRRFKPMPVVLDPSESWGLGQLIAALQASKFDMDRVLVGGDWDDDNIQALVGWEAQMSLKTEEGFKMRPPTPDEIAAGASPKVQYYQTDGNGEKISTGHWVQAKLSDITGPAIGNAGTSEDVPF